MTLKVRLARRPNRVNSPQSKPALDGLGQDRAAALADCGVHKPRLAALLKPDQQAFDPDLDATIAVVEGGGDALLAARRQFLKDSPDMTLPDGFVEPPGDLNVVDNPVAWLPRSFGEA